MTVRAVRWFQRDIARTERLRDLEVGHRPRQAESIHRLAEWKLVQQHRPSRSHPRLDPRGLVGLLDQALHLSLEELGESSGRIGRLIANPALRILKLSAQLTQLT